MTKKIDMAGQRIGRLIVIAEVGSKEGRTLWQCKCDCGNETVVLGKALRRRRTTLSCGCLQREAAAATRRTHGMSRSREFRIWQLMIDRCTNSNNRDYRHYGGRGIAVDIRWSSDFSAFYADMGPSPTSLHTIDRIDNDGPYNAINCRWATRFEQAGNTRRIRLLTHKDMTLSVSEWARRTGLTESTIRARIDRYGWSIEKALTTRRANQSFSP